VWGGSPAAAAAAAAGLGLLGMAGPDGPEAAARLAADGVSAVQDSPSGAEAAASMMEAAVDPSTMCFLARLRDAGVAGPAEVAGPAALLGARLDMSWRRERVMRPDPLYANVSSNTELGFAPFPSGSLPDIAVERKIVGAAHEKDTR